MKFLKYLLVAALAMGSGSIMQSCGDDEPEVVDPGNTDDPSNPDQPNQPDQPGNLPSDPTDVKDPVAPTRDEKPSANTPEESKKSLEDTGIKVSKVFNPDDQKVVTDFANEFNDLYAEFDAPTEWDIYEDDEVFNLSEAVRNIGRAAYAPTVANLTRATQVYELYFARFTGIFEPGNNEWKKVSDSDDIVFRYNNRAGNPVIIRLTASGKNDLYTYTDEYNDEEYRITPPRTVNLTVTQNGTSLVDCTVDALVNENGHTANVSAKGRIANIDFSSLTEAIDKSITQKAILKVDGKSIVTVSAVINGSNLANRTSIENLVDNPTASNFDAMLKNAVANVDVFGETQVRASGANVGEIIRAFDTDKCWDNYDYDDKEAARTDCQKACDVANNNVLARLYFNGSKNYDATVILAPDYAGEDYGDWGWWEWCSLPMIKFNDGTSYTIEGYFGGNHFESVADTWSSLWDSYSNLWR